MSTPETKLTNGRTGEAPTAAPERLVVPVVPVERCFDAVALNEVVNDPAVLPWVRGGREGALDLTGIAADPRNVLLAGAFGSMLFMPMGPGLWELHTQVLPEGRGAWTLGLGASAFAWMFTHTDAIEVLTRVPVGNVAAAAAVRRAGFALQWMQPAGWVFDGVPVDAGIWSMSLQTWLAGAFAAPLEEHARGFLAVVAPEEPPRPDVLRPLGFALAAIRGRQTAKGCAFLNRWGVLSGFPPAFVAAADPLTVSIGGMLFRVSPDGEIVAATTTH